VLFAASSLFTAFVSALLLLLLLTAPVAGEVVLAVVGRVLQSF
jgi:hypothetical protein